MIYMLLFPLSFLDKHFSNWCLPKVPNAKYDLKEIKKKKNLKFFDPATRQLKVFETWMNSVLMGYWF